MRQSLLAALLALTFALLSGCSDDATETPNGCIEGTSQSCACTDGTSGAQSCNASGTFDPCQCAGSLDAGNPGDSGGNNGGLRNECGGTANLDASPGDSCGDCADGVLICDGVEALRCFGASERNACNGCTELRGTPGEICGPCGETGSWTCEGTDSVYCDGAATLNACGGCGTLSGDFLDNCDSGAGYLSCSSDEELICVPVGSNRCGGIAPLSGNPGAACGECLLGKYQCDGDDAVVCNDGAVQRNSCGGCGQLAAEPGAACGSCGGIVECNGSEGTRCDVRVNACGGCARLSNLPGASCPGGVWACDGAGALTCSPTATNACGGSAALGATPGQACGACGDGTVICAALDLTICVDATPTNACGGCTLLDRQPGESCGPQEVVACDGTDAVTCTDSATTNACGGSAVLENTRGATCGECGTYQCDGPDALSCQSEDFDPGDRFNCGTCGTTCAIDQVCKAGNCDLVQGGSGVWTDIELGRAHGCALNDIGDVLCWGDNSQGQLGVGGGPQPVAEPVRVIGVNNAIDIAVDGDLSCALETSSTMKCWGTAAMPQLFGGTTTSSSPTPVVVSNLPSLVVQIDAGGDTLCAITGSGSAYCWGDNQYGKVGYVQPLTNVGPGAAVGGLTNVSKISVGARHVCAIQNAQAFCWGSDFQNRLGDGGNQVDSDTPSAVDLPGQTFTAISAGFDHTCGVANSSLYCWGNNSSSQVSFGNAASPFLISSLGSVSQAWAGKETSFAARFAGATVAWGRADGGRLGNGAAGGTYSPNTVPILGEVPKDLDMSESWGCLIDSTDQVLCWGTPPATDYPSVLLDDQLTPAATQYRPTRSPFVGGSNVERCTDGVDNDSDGDIDCADDDCLGGRITGTGDFPTSTVGFTESDKNLIAIDASCGTSDGIEKRFLWTAPSSGDFSITGNVMFGADFNYYVLDSCSANLRTQLACYNYESAMMPTMSAGNEFTAAVGQTYVIVAELRPITGYYPDAMLPYYNEYYFTISPVP